jgi:hypothetical protein
MSGMEWKNEGRAIAFCSILGYARDAHMRVPYLPCECVNGSGAEILY